MKASILSITFSFLLLPVWFLNFNTSLPAPTSKVSIETHAKHCSSSCAAFHQHAEKKYRFGSELGKYIKETQLGEGNYKIQKIVIDPGHGGRDGGCSGKNTREKKISLKIALDLGRRIQQIYPEVQIIFTRTQDVFVPLNRRAEIANKNQADLFISIHCNNIPNASQVKGSETYVLGLHRAKDNLDVAKRENASIFYEDNYQKKYDGYDPNSAEGHIILSMFQNAYLEQSILLAEKIERNIKQGAHRRSRGVKQAGFLVLRKTTMPSVLVEAGYLSNSKDNQYLATDLGQKKVANAIFNAFAEYKEEVEGQVSSGISRTVQVSEKVRPKVVTPQRRIQPRPQQDQLTAKGGSPKTASKVALSKPSLIIPSSERRVPMEVSATSRKKSAVQYKVVMTLTEALANTDSAPWNKIDYSVEVQREGNGFRYLDIGFTTLKEAVEAKKELRKLGFDEAFVAAYQDGKRVSLN